MNRADHPNWFGPPDNPPLRNAELGEANEFPTIPGEPPLCEPARKMLVNKPTAPVEAEPIPIAPPEIIAERFARAAPGIYTAHLVGAVMTGMDRPDVMMHYLHNLTLECNAHVDPLQRMLLEQIAQAYHRVSALHTSSASATSPELMMMYNAGATRLLAELRKCLLALKELQAVPVNGSTVKKITKSRKTQTPQNPVKLVSELGGNVGLPTHGTTQNGKQLTSCRAAEKPEASIGRTAKSSETNGNNNGRSGKTAQSDPDPQTLEAVNGTPQRRW